VSGIDEVVGFMEAGVGQLRQRVERAEQTIWALLEDIASNPHHAVEMAKLIFATTPVSQG
jgi:hypothetical protein